MSIEKEDNIFYGDSYIITGDTPLDEFPQEVINLMSSAELDAYKNINNYLESKIEKATNEKIKQFLSYLISADNLTFECHTSEVIGNQNLFRFDLKNGLAPAISIPKENIDLSRLPKAISEIYGCIGSTKHTEWEEAGGLAESCDLTSVQNSGFWLENEDDINANSIVFYSTRNGDSMCFNNEGKALSYQHESGSLIEWGDLDVFIQKYLTHMINGQYIDCGQ